MKKGLLFWVAVLLISASHSQTKITSATFGMMEARWLGPGTMSGRITAIEGVNSDGKTIYVGTAGGGVWKTTNAGVTFKPIFDKYTQSIGALAVDQKNSKVIYVGTGESNMRNSVSIGDGLYKSTDGGDNWTKIGLEATEHISKIVIDPSNSNTLYVAAPGPLWSDGSERGLYKSTDGGKTWSKILYINEKAGCADVALDPADPNTVYASTWEFRRLPYSFNSGGTGSGMYKSTDGGKTWKELTKGLPPKPFGRIAFALAPSAPKNIVAIVESKETGLYISSDGGDSWKQQSATANIVARPFYFSTIAVDPNDPKRVYRPAYTFSYSTDGGYSFADASYEGGGMHADMHALWINPNNTNQLYVGTDGGVYFSLDRGVTWNFVLGLPVGQFYHAAVDNREPYFVYGGLQDNGSWMAPSSAPGGVSNAAWKDIFGGDGFWVQPDPTDPSIAYAEAQGGEMGRVNLTTNKTVSIKPQQASGDEKLRWNWNTPIVVGSKNKKNLYTGSQYLYRSTDQGRNWTKLSPDLTTNDRKKQEQEESGGLSADVTSAENHCTIFTIAESPLDELLLWVGTDDGNLQYTADGGRSWNNVSKNYAAAGIPAGTWVSSIEPSAHDKKVVYASFDNHMYGDHKTYVAVSTDMGKNWRLLQSPEFTGFAHKVKEDPKNRELLFIGTEKGLFASVDGGANWFRMKNKIPDYTLVRDIQIHPITNDLVLATHGRGIMIVDDISPMRSLTKNIIDKEVYLFDLKPMTLTMGKFGYSGGSSGNGWVAPNAPSIPPIQYYFKERISSGEVAVEVYDAAGKLVKSVPGSIRKGINKVTWDLKMKPPKVASGGAKIDYSGLLAPMVPPGDYTIKLKVGDKVYAKPLKLVHDVKNKDFTLADRQAQYQSAMQLYSLHEKLAGTVDSISNKQKALQAYIAKTKDSATKKMLQEYSTKLENLRSTLLATKQRSMFADEKKLREDITEVYVAVVNQEARPSNMHLQRIVQLQQQVSKAEEERKTIERGYQKQIESALAREGISDQAKIF